MHFLQYNLESRMKKANGILVFGILFLLLSIGYVITSLEIYTMEPNQEMTKQRENQMAFVKTTFWSGIIMIGIAFFLRIKAKKNNN